jgi:FixJ family two-component response regulator
VLTDLEMPVISGYDVAVVLAQRLPELPVVVMSGRVTDDPRMGAARAVLHKPFAREELCRALAAEQRDLTRATKARSQGSVAAALALHRRPREP